MAKGSGSSGKSGSYKKAFGEVASSATEGALGGILGKEFQPFNEYAGNVLGGIASGGKKGGISQAATGIAERALSYAPKAFGYESPSEGSFGESLNRVAAKTVGSIATGSRSGAIGTLAESATREGLSAYPETFGYQRPQEGSTTDRLNRFASRVVGGAAGGAALGAVTGPGALATATVGAVAGGLYDLAETGVELAKGAFQQNSAPSFPEPQKTWSDQMASISPPSNLPQFKTGLSRSKMDESKLMQSSRLLASALR